MYVMVVSCDGATVRRVSSAQDLSPVGYAASWQLVLPAVYRSCHLATAS